MLNNKWIITKKFADKQQTGMLHYEITPIDGTKVYGNRKYIWSYRHFDVGTYTDANLNPIIERYKESDVDVATIEMTSNPIQNTSVKQVNVFGRRFGNVNLLFETKGAPFSIRRGDTILMQCRLDALQGTIFAPLYNLTTGAKAKYFPHSKHAFGNCDKVLVTGIDSIDTFYETTQKHLLAYSNRFGYVSLLVNDEQPEFATRTNDEIIIERHHNKNLRRDSYRILSNLSIDAGRANFLKHR